MSAREWIAQQLRIGGEMVKSATRNGTMPDASMMEVIVARKLQVKSARMKWLS